VSPYRVLRTWSGGVRDRPQVAMATKGIINSRSEPVTKPGQDRARVRERRSRDRSLGGPDDALGLQWRPKGILNSQMVNREQARVGSASGSGQYGQSSVAFSGKAPH
jgi:hypothetical protein